MSLVNLLKQEDQRTIRRMARHRRMGRAVRIASGCGVEAIAMNRMMRDLGTQDPRPSTRIPPPAVEVERFDEAMVGRS